MPKPVARKTRAKSLHVESMSKVRDIDSILSNGCTTIVVILAEWCGACKRVKPMWLNALKKKKKNNLVLINNEVLPKTPLNSLNITHFPSTFEIPSGGRPTLLDNPQNTNDIEKTLNSGADEVDEVDEVPGLKTPISASEYLSMRNTNNDRMNTTRTMRMNTTNNDRMNTTRTMRMNNTNNDRMNNTNNDRMRNTNNDRMNTTRAMRMNNTGVPSPRNTNRNGSTSLKVFTPRNGFTPSLEKLKGGRRTRKRRS